MVTNVDPASMDWAIDDPVLRLRVFGSEYAYDLATSGRWVIGSSRECSLHLEIEETARRLVALRHWGVGHGSQRLGISHGALSRWARRRGLPT